MQTLDNDLAQPRKADLTRRAIVTSGLTLAAGMLANPLRPVEAARLRNKDIAILNFALHLEYLEAEFYLFAATGEGLSVDLISGRGTQGATTGGSQVALSEEVRTLAEEIANDERDHVILLRAVLGRKAVAKPAINLNALGAGFASETEFLLVARKFEDLGVSAYGGAAGSIKNGKVLTTAARILAVEAYHAGNIRLQVLNRTPDESDTPLDQLDQPVRDANQFPTTDDGLSLIRTPAQVAALAAPFFPKGLNSRVP